ncbi:MAG: hypothetical protein NTW31_12785 [Bacteroidetes bacterium]|nr:hypothetical protein [Bacteroidota bacterium]
MKLSQGAKHEMMEQKGQTITIITGSLIPWQSFDKTQTDLQWAELVKQTVYGLPKMQS